MTFVDKPLERMMEEIEFTHLAEYDFWAPESFPQRCERRMTPLGRYLNPTEDYVQTFLRQIPDTCGIILDRMVTGAVLLAMENSFTHGHQLQEYLPISLKLFAGNNGCVVRICDSGAGFDYPEMYRRVRDGERILKTRGGMGTAIFLFRGFEISYEGKGNIFNLQINRGYNPERSLHLLSGE